MSNSDYIEEDIEYFYKSSRRNKNDLANKKRENILIDLINQSVNENYFNSKKYGRKWRFIRNNISNILKENYGDYKEIKCIKKAGRQYNYDFDIEVIDKDNIKTINKLEFKYGKTCINLQPQFVSLGNITLYFDISFINFIILFI